MFVKKAFDFAMSKRNYFYSLLFFLLSHWSTLSGVNNAQLFVIIDRDTFLKITAVTKL